MASWGLYGRTCVLLAATSLAISSLFLAPDAGARGRSKQKISRVQELTYQDPTIGIDFPSYQMVTCDSGCVVFDVHPGERYVTLETDDLVSPDVALAVFPWDGAAAEPRFDEHHYCTSIDEPLRLPRWALRLWVEVLIGPCRDGTPGTATQGKVVATFTNLP